MKRVAAGIVGLGFAALAGLVLAPVGGADAASPVAAAVTTTTTTPPNPTTEILAVVSPIASPVCGASGTATLLVPIVSGVLQADLGLPKSVSIGSVVLNALGPVYVVCGDLPGSSGTQCSLDDEIAGVWPASLPPDGLTPPALVGDLVDSIDNGLKVLGLAPSAALAAALRCQVRAGSTAPRAPGAPAPPPSASTSPSDAPPSAGGLPTSALAEPVPSATALSNQATAASGSPAASVSPAPAGTEQLVGFLRHHVPSWLLALQLIAGIVLALFLGGSWLTSARVARNSGTAHR